MPRPLPPPAPRTRWSAPVVAACATALLATGCAADSAADSPAGTTGAGPAPTGGHGYVAGAEELGEPQLQLTHLDEAGSVHALDLLTGESAPVGEVGRTDAVASDGRFLFTSGPAGRLSVVDTGTWTVDHGDHVHYYRAPARVVGTLAWSGEVRAASSETLTALFSPTTGAGVVLDRAALGQGEIETVATSAGVPHDGALVPLGSRVVATGPASVEVREDGGDPTGTEAPCTDPRGGAATRVGVVVSCADGAVLATETAEGVTLERIPYPSPVADGDRAVSLANRAGRPVLAAPAGQHGVWLLDTRARSWQLVPTATPWAQAVAADDAQDRVVGLDTGGRVVVLEPATGALAATEPLVAPDQVADVVLQVDADRAYLNVPDQDQLVEVDYADGARLARTFPTAVTPDHLAETGR